MEDAMLTTTNRNWEALFQTWGQPPSDTEKQRCENAVTAVQKAIAASTQLKARDVIVTPQGSYHCGTNVRQDSDVDLSIRCRGLYLTHYPEGVTQKHAGLVDSQYGFANYKNDVGEALVNHFGSQAVSRGSKAFDIHANTYRVDADAAPCLIYRHYYWDEL
jgi:hypothetical protein